MGEWSGILDAVQVSLDGDRSHGKELLDACWARTAGEDHAQRCVLAHYLADLQDSLDGEIAWDETALNEYRDVAESDLEVVGLSARSLAPSLHLNLGDGYARRGDVEAARRQLAAGLASVAALPDGGYGALIRLGLDRLARRLGGADRTSTGHLPTR